jgi:hypothetical protein
MKKQRKVHTKRNHPQREIIEAHNKFSPYKGFKFSDEEIEMINDLVKLNELGGEDKYYSKPAAWNSINGKRGLPFVKHDAIERCRAKIIKYSEILKNLDEQVKKNKEKIKATFEGFVNN